MVPRIAQLLVMMLIVVSLMRCNLPQKLELGSKPTLNNSWRMPTRHSKVIMLYGRRHWEWAQWCEAKLCFFYLYILFSVYTLAKFKSSVSQIIQFKACRPFIVLASHIRSFTMRKTIYRIPRNGQDSDGKPTINCLFLGSLNLSYIATSRRPTWKALG